jgi:hypothetical protein
MFVMSYFRTEAEALHLAISEDGLAWTSLRDNAPMWHASVGNRSVRDPHLSQSRDGLFHLFSTDSWRSDRIIHAVSDDLLHWCDETLRHVMSNVSHTRNCWAPECFYDEEAELYRVIWSSTVGDGENPCSEGYDHRIWGCTTRDFREYSEASLFFDPGYNVIDASVIRCNDQYLMAFKDERGENRLGTDYKAIRVCTAQCACGPWTEISELMTPTLTEGPTMFMRDGHIVMLYDHFFEHYFGASQSDDGVHWTSITAQMQFPPGPRHASVIEVDDAVAEPLRRLV